MMMSTIDAGGDVREPILFSRNFGCGVGQDATAPDEVWRDPVSRGVQAAAGDRDRRLKWIGTNRLVRNGKQSALVLRMTKRDTQWIGAVVARFSDVRGSRTFQARNVFGDK